MSEMQFGRLVPPHAREAVAWYQPDVLLTAAREVVSSMDQLRNRDFREAYELPLTVIDCSERTAGSAFWFDFIADTGDSGNATYAVANAALKDRVAGGQHGSLERGQLLLFGGDLAYPSASPDAYRYRFIEMFEGARHDLAAGQSKVRGHPFTLAALAQNHDWMDSANTFNRYFIRNKDSSTFLGASIPQKQSYFCVKLPDGWWALGFDFALTGDIDRVQYEQFERLASDKGLENTVDGVVKTHRIAPTDRVIVIYPEPYWTRPIGDGAPPTQPKRYQRLEGLLGTRIALRLAGDLHHYMRWESQDHGRIVTCGTGGAFTHPTHTYTTTRPVVLRHLSNSNAVPPEKGLSAVAVGLSDGKSAHVHYTRDEDSVYPAAKESRSRAVENLWALFRRNRYGRGGNWLFAGFMGFLYWFNAYLNSMPFTHSFRPDGFRPMWDFALSDYLDALVLWGKAMTFSPLGFVLNVVMIVACVLMGREAVNELPPRTGRGWRAAATIGMSSVHVALHVLAVFSLAFGLQQVVKHIPLIGQPGPTDSWATIGHSVVIGAGLLIGGGIVGAFVFGLYLAVMSWLRLLTNNGYSALGIEDYKGFLRFRISDAGRLDAYFIAIDRVPRKWTHAHGQWPVWVKADGAATPERVHDHFSVPSDVPQAVPRRTDTEPFPA